jgi:hypothetical protein
METFPCKSDKSPLVQLATKIGEVWLQAKQGTGLINNQN